MHAKRQLKNADLARRVYKLVGRPAHAFFVEVIRENQLKNCPVTVNNANRAIKIYSPDVDALRGKTTRTTPAHVPSNQLRPLPFELLDTKMSPHASTSFSSMASPSLARSHATSTSSRLNMLPFAPC
jgi:hypothetical protein